MVTHIGEYVSLLWANVLSLVWVKASRLPCLQPCRLRCHTQAEAEEEQIGMKMFEDVT